MAAWKSRLRILEGENSELTKLLAETMLNKAALEAAMHKKRWRAVPSTTADRRCVVRFWVDQKLRSERQECRLMGESQKNSFGREDLWCWPLAERAKVY